MSRPIRNVGPGEWEQGLFPNDVRPYSAPTLDAWGRDQRLHGKREHRQILNPPASSPPGWGPCAFSEDRKHRWTLARSFGAWTIRRRMLWIMLNPSTADESRNDPTITRCCGFAQRWGFDALAVANLFSLRSTYPKKLLVAAEPEGDPENLMWIVELASRADLIVCAWGNHGSVNGRDATVLECLRRDGRKLFHLGLSQAGSPFHPLYLNNETPLIEWKDPQPAVASRRVVRPRVRTRFLVWLRGPYGPPRFREISAWSPAEAKRLYAEDFRRDRGDTLQPEELRATPEAMGARDSRVRY